MRKYLSVYNLLGLLVFALGLFVYWQSPVPNPPKALPLPADEAATAAVLKDIGLVK